MASSTVEDYLKRLYLEQQKRPRERVAMGRLAAVVGVAPGTATAMVKTLAASRLVDYEPYAGVRLTRNGAQLALRILRRHRIIEQFLVEVLGMDWSDVHEEAERLEHAVSDRVLERLDALLGHPTVDPHGDPIPTATGRVDRQASLPLSEVEKGARLRVVRVTDQSPRFLHLADRHGLRPGVVLDVEAHDETADTLRLKVKRRGTVVLGGTAAGKILVEPA